MANQTTRSKEPASQDQPVMGLWKKVVLAVALLPFAALFLPSVAVLALGMLPTLGAYVADRDREKYLTVTVGLLNFCGTVHPLLTLWEMGQGYGALNHVIYDIYNWLVAYGLAGCGWLIYLLMPPVAASYYKVVTQARIQMLGSNQRKLVETWGEEVNGGPAAPDAAARENP